MVVNPINAQQHVQVGLQNLEQQIGDVIDVPLSISTSGLLVATYRIDVEYDPSVLQVLSLQQGQAPFAVISNLNEPGVVKLAGFHTNGRNTDFIGATLQFEVIGLAGQLSYLNIIVFDITDSGSTYYLHEHNNGEVAINCIDQIHIGNPQFQQIDEGVFRANVSLSSDVIIDGDVKTVLFRAGEAIDLTPDFEVKNGSTFEAEILNCQNLNNNYRSRIDRFKSKFNRSSSSIEQSNTSTQDMHRNLGTYQLGKAIEIKDDAN